MNSYLADLLYVSKSDVRPAGAGVSGLVNTIALRGRDVAQRRFPHADYDDIRIRWCDCDCAHRGGAEVVVRDYLPVRTGIARFPDSTGSTHVINVRVLTNANRNHRPAAAERPDVAGLNAVKEFPLRIVRRAGHQRDG